MKLYELDSLLSKYEKKLGELEKIALNQKIEESIEAYPFNSYELRLTYLLDKEILDYKEYERIRKDYISSNKYLELYGLAPRIFGQVWGEEHILSVDTRFQKASKSLDVNYCNEYDLWLNGIKIEVKASHASDKKIRGNPISKALHIESDRSFWMNFQQIKFNVCDYFIFIGVWVDNIKYWVLSENEVKTHPNLSHQHRGGVEYQIGITDKNIDIFNKFLKNSKEIADYIIRDFNENQS